MCLGHTWLHVSAVTTQKRRENIYHNEIMIKSKFDNKTLYGLINTKKMVIINESIMTEIRRK